MKTKNYFIVAMIIWGFIINGCDTSDLKKDKSQSSVEKILKQENFQINYKIIFDDRGCEYLVVSHSQGIAIVHLPKCRNHY